jgi:phosphoribosyl 1,2-cyclic phosphate phosphodiesterase
MKLVFFGTGTSKGIPVIGCNHPVCLSDDPRDNRMRSSVLITKNNKNYLIDCGPDFRMQMLNNKVSKIEAILYTHEHADHTAGLDDIRPITQKYGDMPLYSYKRVMDNLAHRFDYIFATENKYPSAPGVIPNVIDNNPFSIGDLKVIPVQVMHGNLPIFGYRIDSLCYITDASFIADKEKEKLKNLDVLVINALRLKEHPTHFNLEKALDLISEVKPKRAYLTHISHKLGFHKEIEKQLPKNVFLAYDGLNVKIE